MATNPWTAEIARINSLIKKTQENIARDQALLAANPTSPDAARWQQQIASGENYLIDLRSQLDIFITEYNNYGKDPSTSSGQIIREEKTTPSNPEPPPTVVAVDGRINPQNLETGTNAPVRTQEQTQATPATPQQPDLIGESYAVPGVVSTSPGVGAPREDASTPNRNTTAQIINASFNKKITPKPNILDQYATYTYAITWYLLTPDQYNEMTQTQKKNCASWQLLMQSGGAPTQAAGVSANSTATAGRNQFFDKDYYIDELEIDSLVPLKGTGAANTATDIKFRVTEPNGITLIENLWKAVSTLYQQKNVDKNANYPLAQYCLVIRFYGYNENGELITTGRSGTNGQNNLTDPRAIVEKFYPFVISNIRFRIPKDRVVEYEVTGKPIPHFYNKSQDRGTIPFAFELVGDTIEKVLVGKPVGTQTPASDGRRDSPQPNTSAPTQPPVGTITGEANQDIGGGTFNSLGAGP